MFNFEGNAAKKISDEQLQEKIFKEQTQEETPKKTGAERLKELRDKQRDFMPGEEFTKEEREEFLQLQNEESMNNGKVIMSDFEQKRFAELIYKRDGDDQVGLTVVEQEELGVLQRKVNDGGLKNRVLF